MLVLSTEHSISNHSVLFHWRARPEWTGKIGSVVAYADKFTHLVVCCETPEDIMEGIERLIGAVTVMAHDGEVPQDAQPVYPTMWWADAKGLEAIGFTDDGIKAGPRLEQALG